MDFLKIELPENMLFRDIYHYWISYIRMEDFDYTAKTIPKMHRFNLDVLWVWGMFLYNQGLELNFWLPLKNDIWTRTRKRNVDWPHITCVYFSSHIDMTIFIHSLFCNVPQNKPTPPWLWILYTPQPTIHRFFKLTVGRCGSIRTLPPCFLFTNGKLSPPLHHSSSSPSRTTATSTWWWSTCPAAT